MTYNNKKSYSFKIETPTKLKQKLKMLLWGNSHTGKTYTSLKIASGFKDTKILVIDTENRATDEYANLVKFDRISLQEKSVEEYYHACCWAKRNGYNFLIIDSLSHMWYYASDQVEKGKSNTMISWGEAKRSISKCLEAIFELDLNIIMTCRAKSGTSTESYIDTNGYTKTRIKKVGLTPDFAKDMDYIFRFEAYMDENHSLVFKKDRNSSLMSKTFDKPDQELGEILFGLLEDGIEHVSEKTQEDNKKQEWALSQIVKIDDLYKKDKLSQRSYDFFKKQYNDKNYDLLADTKINQAIDNYYKQKEADKKAEAVFNAPIIDNKEPDMSNFGEDIQEDREIQFELEQ